MKKRVYFTSTLSEFDNCICSACHDTGQVVKISMPKTLYFDGKELSTKYSSLWLCESCQKLLMAALIRAKEKATPGAATPKGDL